jgi:hypothetical protein
MSRENSYDEEDESDGPEPEIHAEPGAPDPRPNVPRLTLHIDLPDLNPEVIRRAVIEMALNQYVIQQTFVTVKRKKRFVLKDMAGNITSDEMIEVDEKVPGPGAFSDVVRGEIAKEMAKLVQPHIRAIMEAQVAEILAGEVQTMNQWGEPKGLKMPIRELIRTTLDGFMREKVDSSGRESPRDGRTRLEWGIVSASSEVFNQHFKPLVEAEVKVIKADLGARIKDSIATAVFSHLGLKLG